MSLTPTPVAGGGALPSNYYFALKNDPGLNQTLDLSGNTLSISNGNSVNLANALSVSTSAFKLTAQTYIPGFLTTNFDGRVQAVGEIVAIANLGGAVAISGNTSEVQISGGLANVPKVRFADSNGVEGIISFENNFIRQTSTSISTLQLAGVVLDSFGNPGSAGQQLQSSGAGLPVVWGAGSGVGLTAVVAGSNIAVDNTNPIAPVVRVAISSDLDMSGNNIRNCVDIDLKGTNPSVNFKNSANVDKAALDYVESSDKISLTGVNVVAEAIGSGSRMLLDAGGATLWSFDANTTLQRSQTGVGIKTIATLQDNGLIQVGTVGVTTFPTVKLQSGTDAGEFVSMSYNATLDKAIMETGTNGQMLIQSGSSAAITSGGTLGITSSDATTITASDSSVTMTADVVVNAVGNIEIGSDAGGFYRCGTNTTAGVGAEIVADDGIQLQAISGSIGLTAGNTATVLIAGAQNLLCANSYNAFGVLTQYDDAFAANVSCDVNKLEQVLSNNAYVPMTYYRVDATLTVDATPTLAIETDDFTWRYSGQFAPSGLTSDSRFCGAVRFQVDVNVAAEDMNDTIVWWVELRDLAGYDHQAMDFKDDRFGYLNERLQNPSTTIKNQTFSFSSIFDLTSSGLPLPTDGTQCRLRLFGMGSTTTSSPRANVSFTIRPIRTLI